MKNMYPFVGRFVLEFNHSAASYLVLTSQLHNNTAALKPWYLQRHSSPRRLAGEKKSDSYNHKTTIWVFGHEFFF